MKSISSETVIRHAGNAISRKINGEVVLLTPEESKVHVLDDVGSRVWELCAESASVSSIVDEITAEYEVERETARDDVIKFVGELLDLGVIKLD